MNQGIIKFPLTVEKVFESPHQETFEKGDIVRSINGVRVNENFNRDDNLFNNSDSGVNLLMLSKETVRLSR